MTCCRIRAEHTAAQCALSSSFTSYYAVRFYSYCFFYRYYGKNAAIPQRT